MQIKVCICSAVPSGYWSGGGEPVQAVAEGYSVSGQAVAGPYRLLPRVVRFRVRQRSALRSVLRS